MATVSQSEIIVAFFFTTEEASETVSISSLPSCGLIGGRRPKCHPGGQTQGRVIESLDGLCAFAEAILRNETE